MGPRAGLDGRKISSPPGLDPGPSIPQSVTIPTELPAHYIHIYIYECVKTEANFCASTGAEDPEEEKRYTSGLSLVSAVEGCAVLNVTSRPLYPPGKRPCSRFIGDCVGLRTCWDGWGKSRPSAAVWSPDSPARSESLYLLSYPGSFYTQMVAHRYVCRDQIVRQLSLVTSVCSLNLQNCDI